MAEPAYCWTVTAITPTFLSMFISAILLYVDISVEAWFTPTTYTSSVSVASSKNGNVEKYTVSKLSPWQFNGFPANIRS